MTVEEVRGVVLERIIPKTKQLSGLRSRFADALDKDKRIPLLIVEQVTNSQHGDRARILAFLKEHNRTIPTRPQPVMS